MNNYLTVNTVSRYAVVVALDIVVTSENIKKHHQKRTQTRKEKENH